MEEGYYCFKTGGLNLYAFPSDERMPFCPSVGGVVFISCTDTCARLDRGLTKNNEEIMVHPYSGEKNDIEITARALLLVYIFKLKILQLKKFQLTFLQDTSGPVSINDRTPPSQHNLSFVG